MNKTFADYSEFLQIISTSKACPVQKATFWSINISTENKEKKCISVFLYTLIARYRSRRINRHLKALEYFSALNEAATHRQTIL